jgi:hypothetical protein
MTRMGTTSPGVRDTRNISKDVANSALAERVLKIDAQLIEKDARYIRHRLSLSCEISVAPDEEGHLIAEFKFKDANTGNYLFLKEVDATDLAEESGIPLSSIGWLAGLTAAESLADYTKDMSLNRRIDKLWSNIALGILRTEGISHDGHPSYSR